LRRWVIDSSVVIKWYVPEDDFAAARAFRVPQIQLAVPDLLFVELSNILWKIVRREKMQPARAIEIIEEIVASPFVTHTNESLARDAIDLALATGVSAYDASYVALAMRLNVQCITADQKLFRMLAGTAAGDYVHLLADPIH
jgi:predicted nucleic acid-binding protein